ncbi:MAG: hypothetical protein JRI97_06890 [Deltaproteobacteria bacterium]|nr:hypothetical protein [Deltaproteobacteria bacterium]
MLRLVRNHRFDPFSQAPAYAAVTDEVHVIPASGVFRVRLWEVPDPEYSHPVSGTPVYIRNLSGTVFTEVSSAPALNEFSVDHAYKTAWVEFNSGNAGEVIYACYQGTGSPEHAELVNGLQLLQPASAYFGGDGSDGDLTLSGNTNLSESPAGSGVAFKQFNNLDLSGYTLSVTGAAKGIILCVRGVLTMDASTVIDLDGKGMSGGAGQTFGYRDGLPGATGHPRIGGGGGGGAMNYANGGAGGGLPGIGGAGTSAANRDGMDGTNALIGPLDQAWRFAENWLPGGGGGGGAAGTWEDGGAGGAGGGLLVIQANVISAASGLSITAGGSNGSTAANGGEHGSGGGGGGAGGTVIIVAHRIVGRTAAQIEAACSVSGGAGGSGGSGSSSTGGDGGAGASGYARCVELYSYNLY